MEESQQGHHPLLGKLGSPLQALSFINKGIYEQTQTHA